MIFIFCLPLGCKKTPLKTDYTQKNNLKQHIAALKDEDSEVRWNAAKALGKIGDAAVAPLIAALKDGDPEVRGNAAKALGEIGDKRAVDPLLDF